MILLYIFTYFSIIVFILLIVIKVIKYAGTPMHLRWELYPVAHEPKRNKYGGSYYEEPEWWTRKIKKNHFAELWAMFEEIFFLKGVYKNNKQLWLFSFPFHIGLYLITATFVLILLSSIFYPAAAVDSARQSGAEYIIFYLTNICGYAGIALTFLGSAGLIIKRLSDKKYKIYNTPIDFINLFFIMILVLSVFITLTVSNSSFGMSKIFMRNLVTFNFSAIGDPYFITHIILVSLFLLYFPLTRMMHMFAKYFTYHNVRWEDEPNLKGGKLEKKIIKALNFGVSWSAGHTKTGNTWAEIATNIPPEMKNAEQNN